jgi:hypothetical protein
MARRAAARYGGRCDGRGLWHNDISRQAGRWVWLGQNVGCGTLGRDGVKASVRRIQNAFMSSPGHRRNILHRGHQLRGQHLDRRAGHLGHGQLQAVPRLIRPGGIL